MNRLGSTFVTLDIEYKDAVGVQFHDVTSGCVVRA